LENSFDKRIVGDWNIGIMGKEEEKGDILGPNIPLFHYSMIPNSKRRKI